MKKLVLLVTLLTALLITGCGGVDKETQKFADNYNKQYVNMLIAMRETQEANKKMQMSNGSAKTFAASEAMKISKDFLAKHDKIKELAKDPKYNKAKEAGIIKEDYKNKTKKELQQIYMDMK